MPTVQPLCPNGSVFTQSRFQPSLFSPGTTVMSTPQDPAAPSAAPARACVHCEAPSKTIKPCSSCPTRTMVCANCTTREFEYDNVRWLCQEHAPPLPAPAPAAPAPPPVPPTPPAMALTPTPLWLSCQDPPPVPPAANAAFDDDLVIPIPDSIVRRSRRKRHLPSHMGGGCRKR